MFLIRGAEARDLEGVLKLARHLNSYNLPADRKAIRRLLADSVRSFRGERVAAERKQFLFVAEEVPGGKVVGTSLIIARHGTPKLPHLSFRLARETKKSSSLQKSVEHRTLVLAASRRGFTEIGGLAVLPAYRGRAEKIGKQLSYARFAFMARHKAFFRPQVLVEYLPPLDPAKGNALWTSLGKPFTGLTYHEADRLSAENKEFIFSLFPREKIYACLLPKAAQKDLGLPGEGARSSLGMLERLGFRFLGQIDPFDGGPHYGAPLRRIPLVRKTAGAKFGGSAAPDAKAPRALVMTESGGRARACLAAAARRKGLVWLPREAARALGLKPRDELSITPFFEP